MLTDKSVDPHRLLLISVLAHACYSFPFSRQNSLIDELRSSLLPGDFPLTRKISPRKHCEDDRVKRVVPSDQKNDNLILT